MHVSRSAWKSQRKQHHRVLGEAYETLTFLARRRSSISFDLAVTPENSVPSLTATKNRSRSQALASSSSLFSFISRCTTEVAIKGGKYNISQSHQQGAFANVVVSNIGKNKLAHVWVGIRHSGVHDDKGVAQTRTSRCRTVRRSSACWERQLIVRTTDPCSQRLISGPHRGHPAT